MLAFSWPGLSGRRKSYASQIAGVGVEGAMQGAAAMGIGAGVFGASRMARGALGMGRNAGIGAWKVCVVRKAGLVSLRE